MPKFIRPYMETDDPYYFGYKKLSGSKFSKVPRAEPAAFEQAYSAFLPSIPSINGGVAQWFDTIKSLVQENTACYAWCQNKVVVVKLEENFRLSKAFTLLCMIEEGRAIVDRDSLDYFARMLWSLSTMKHMSSRLESLNILADLKGCPPLMSAIPNPRADLFMSALHPDSLINSGELFHTICANEARYSARLFVETFYDKTPVQACNDFFSYLDGQQKTPLIAATLYGMHEAVQVMCEKASQVDIRVNAKDDKGFTALDYAWLLGYTPLVMALLKVGAEFSSPTVIAESQNPRMISWVFRRAILCPDRDSEATHNYLYHSGGINPPLMASDNGITWRFVILHPHNPDAIDVIKNNPEAVNEESKWCFQRLTASKEPRITIGEKRLQALQNKAFLCGFALLLTRLGRYREVIALLDAYPSFNLLFNPEISPGFTLLHACTNSYSILANEVTSSNFLNSEQRRKIIEGRVKLAQYILESFPQYIGNTTRTANGEEDFAAIVKRLYDDSRAPKLPSTNPVAVDFNTSLYTQLLPLCTPTADVKHETAMECCALAT